MKKKVLILCTQNSCRSQMAEGILRHYGSDTFEVFSAGTRPSHVNPVAIQVMKEICPIFPGPARHLHWSFPDPPHDVEITEKVIHEFRKVRGLIHEKFKRAAETGVFDPSPAR